MKWFRKTTISVGVIVLLAFVLTYCTKNDQVITSGGAGSSTTLTVGKTTTAPVIDGSIDAVWSTAKELNMRPIVPNPTTKLWSGQSSNYTFDVNGNITSIPFNEHKFGFQWSINNSSASILPGYGISEINSNSKQKLKFDEN
jgi:hypothetical protein